MPLRLILYEGPGSQPWSDEERFALLTALLDKGWSVSRVLAPEAVLANDDRLVLVLGRFNGPVPAFGAGDSARMQVRDATGFDPARVLEEAEAFRAGTQTPKAGAWLPWFPVIDYDRCTNCMQCLSFCLFDVYGVSADQKIEVHHSANCKTNCPACSRVCPEAAIMFPKYKTGPIHGGEVTEADLRREAMKVDISALLGGDIYSLLRQRSTQARTRFSKERDPDQALQERRKCLTKLAQMADIPPEVLMSLPSPEEIQRRATEAAAKAKAALAQRSEELKG
ncbi:MAG: ferredoxin family protein [Verrucomicrobia bacterium]|nr:ferredoxin family protein [Verrucomicrobiota bacterium]